jgi:beta-galactosidase
MCFWCRLLCLVVFVLEFPWWWSGWRDDSVLMNPKYFLPVIYCALAWWPAVNCVARENTLLDSGWVFKSGEVTNAEQHEENPKLSTTTGPWHPEEYQAIVHEAEWKQFKSHPFIWGTFMWNMFDFCVANRHEGGQIALNNKGLVTYDRKIKKDAFYFYQANWSPQPVLYITSRRFTERRNSVPDVKIYSNANEAELLLNGVSQGKCSNDGNAVFIWKNVQSATGENKIEAEAERDGQSLADRCTWKLASP